MTETSTSSRDDERSGTSAALAFRRLEAKADPSDDPAAAVLACDLLAADSLETLAQTLVDYARRELACSNAVLVWALDWPGTRSVWPARELTSDEVSLANLAIASPGRPAISADGYRLALNLCAPGARPGAALVAEFDRSASGAVAWARWHAFLAVARPAVGHALENARLRNSVEGLERAEKLQRALFAIADMASSELDMAEMLRGLHQIVGSLMYAENFFIALYDPTRDAMRFIYFADVSDDTWKDPNLELPMRELEHGLTWYLIRDGKPLMGSTPELRAQVSGTLRTIGTDSRDWLGVPMLSGTMARGALVVQSYVERPRYTVDDQALLSFVATHILTALERKQAQEELERRVRQRTADLAQANAVLTGEVLERQRGERLQTALFRIAELSHSGGGMEAFYAAVHGIIGGLINATNFYIALLSEDRTQLQFPYWVDERQTTCAPRPLGRGGTEYVIRTGKPMLIDSAEMDRLHASGEVVGVGERSQCWLGVPLICAEGVVGAIAVQSYSADVHYTERDRELLTFVSYQLANSLERKRADEALKQANAELEQRVTDRTRQLSEQISVRERIELDLKHRNADLEAVNQKLAGTKSQLLQSEKMASVGQLAAGVAHEINNPIGYVRSNLSSLDRYIKDVFALIRMHEEVEATLDPSQVDLAPLRKFKQTIELDFLREDLVSLLSECVEGTTRVQKIVADLKDFSHVDQAEWQEVDIHQCLESTLNVVAHELKYKAELVREYGVLPPIECLPFQLNQVFVNLLVNAAQAIEKRGTIVIRTGRDNDTVWLAFSDNGKGIDAANVNRIFEPFFTTKPVGVGTGLGLSVSYGIVQKHGGTIDVASEPGKGTTFTIRLPIQPKRA